MDISKLVKRIRINKGMSRADFSNLLHITEFEWAQIETGKKRPSPYLLRKIADVTLFSFADLLLAARIIDFYKSEKKVCTFFDRLALQQEEYVHIKSVDHLTNDEIEEIVKDYKKSGKLHVKELAYFKK